jgi:hypothetical protein
MKFSWRRISKLRRASVSDQPPSKAFRCNDVCADIFKFDPNYLENEEKYKAIKVDILGDGSSDDESESEESDTEDEGTPVSLSLACAV